MDEKTLFTNFWTNESKTTSKVLARIPEGSDYRPDLKSRTAQEIAWQIVCEEKMIIEALEEEGFEITRNVAGMPTAFAAEAGSGLPILGFLGQFHDPKERVSRLLFVLKNRDEHDDADHAPHGGNGDQDAKYCEGPCAVEIQQPIFERKIAHGFYFMWPTLEWQRMQERVSEGIFTASMSCTIC